MNVKTKSIIKNFSYSFATNISSLVISILSMLIIPKLIDIKQYGYWQIYMFYVSYIGLFHFGLADGVYLKYGGENYNKLDKKLFLSQFWILFSLELFISFIVVVYSMLFINDINRMFIFEIIGINLIIVVPNALLQSILLGTNRINQYAKSTIFQQGLYGLLIITLLVGGIRNFKLLIVMDVLSKICSFVLNIKYCKDIVIGKLVCFNIGLMEAFDNIRVGINLMFSNIASRAIIGIVRIGIEKKWDVITFGKVSLTLSISNLLMLFINAIGVVLYPILRNTEVRKLPRIYVKMRNILIVPLLGLLIIYYPANIIFKLWLPKYSDSLIYMALLFPICIFESKMSMLVNTYFNTLRKEKLRMIINLVTLGLSAIVSYVTIYIFSNLTLAVLSITYLLAFRCIISEIMLSKILYIDINFDILLELFMITIFIIIAWFSSTFIGAIIYSSVYMIYLYFKRNNVVEIKNLFLSVIKKTN